MTVTSTEESVTTELGTEVRLRRDEGEQTLLCAYVNLTGNRYSGGQQVAGALSHDESMRRITGSDWSLTTSLPGLLAVPTVYVRDEAGVRAWLLFLADLYAGNRAPRVSLAERAQQLVAAGWSPATAVKLAEKEMVR